MNHVIVHERMIMQSMMDFNTYIEKQGSIYLKQITFELLNLETPPQTSQMVMKDHLKTELVNSNRQLSVTFTRTIAYRPKPLYTLSVSYGALYTFKSDVMTDELSKMDFSEILMQNKNTMFRNIVSRTSQLISQITSSHGTTPLVTPPVFVKKN